jgi:hypothetical protein
MPGVPGFQDFAQCNAVMCTFLFYFLINPLTGTNT